MVRSKGGVMKVKQGLFIAGAIFQVAVLGVTVYFLQEVKQEPMVEEEGEKSALVPFSHYVTGEGRIACSQVVRVHVKREGVVDQLRVHEGDLVTLGQPLFQIEDGMLRFAFREKIAEYEKALAEVKLLEKGPSEFDLRAKEKEMDQVDLKLAQEAKENVIYLELFDKQAISQSKKERQETAVKIATAEKERILTEYLKLKAGPTEEEKEVRRAELREKEMKMRSAEKALSDCQVLSPLEGKVLKVHVHPGEYIKPGEEALSIGSEHPLHLRVLIDESEMWRILPNKQLKAVAVHRMNPNIHFIPSFVALTSSEEAGKMELVFAFEKGNAPLYLDQTLDVYVEAASPQDTSYYQFITP